MTSRPRRRMPSDDASLPELERRLARQRERARRAWRKYMAADDAVASSKAHREWSDAVDDALGIVEEISKAPVHELRGLLIQFEATWWWIGADDNVLDESTRRWLGRFRRSLRGLATER